MRSIDPRAFDLTEIAASDVAHASTVPPPGDAELPSNARVGRYVVLKVLGRGGMGIVYAAYDEQLDRRVALKLLAAPEHGSQESQAAGQRLLREAQALAKLSHPNVVAAFEVGTFGDRVFLAMEYIDGATLRAWQAAAPRKMRETVAIYLQAGRGLEAAHAAGIVHRDFKPENVLVDAKGRVRVVDFGLARIDAPPTSLLDATLDSTETELKAPSLPLTRYGALLGTPAYMAPEQLHGTWAEAPSDQFAFSVALYEALYGERPFEARTLHELRDALDREEVRPPPAGTKVPRRLRAVLLRGLRAKPVDRFAGMGELLDALDRATDAPRRQTVALAVASVAVAVVAAIALRPARPPICAGAGDEIGSAWGEPQRASVARAFAGSGNLREAGALERVRATLDGYADRWAAMRMESCQATRLRGVQSDEALDLRTACLDQRQRELSATVELLAKADAKLVDNAVTMVRGLADLSQCADVASLRAPYAQPHDPAKRQALDAVRAQVARGTALALARKHDDAIAALAVAARSAKEAGNRAVEGAALVVEGRAQNACGRSKEALATVLDAALAANVARDDATEAAAWTLLVRIVGYDLGRFEDSEVYARLADAAVVRAGDGAGLRAELVRYRAHTLYARGKLDDSLALYRESLALRERAFTADSPELASGQVDLADVYADMGRLAEARGLYDSALAKMSMAYGEGHPQVGVLLVNLAELLIETGDPAGGIRAARRSLATVDEDDTLHAASRLCLARGLLVAGDVDAGQAEGRAALAETARLLGPDSWQLGTARVRIAESLVARHLFDAAAPEVEGAIAALDGKDLDPSVLRAARQIRARCLVHREQAALGAAEADRALVEEEKESGKASSRLLMPLLAVGEGALGLGDVPRALAALERGAAIADGAEGYPVLHADVHAALSRALRAHADADRGRALAQRAANEYEAAGLKELARQMRGGG